VEAEQEKRINEILKDRHTGFQRIKEKIRMARKPRMRVVEKLLCDKCDSLIVDPEDGFIVHGNIYVADPSRRGGLVGDNFPPPEDGTLDQVRKSVFCKDCFVTVVGLEDTPPPNEFGNFWMEEELALPPAPKEERVKGEDGYEIPF
jgi:hypothetical protein